MCAARMEFSLQSAYAHGTRAIRTHLDSIPPQDAISFPVFAEMRSATGQGRIDLQAACLIGAEDFSTDGPFRPDRRHRGRAWRHPWAWSPIRCPT